MAEPEYNSGNSCSPPDCKWDQEGSKVIKKISDSTISLDVGVGLNKLIGNCVIGTDAKHNIAGNLVVKLAKDENNLGIVESLTNQDLFCERSLKRPKLGVN